LRTYADGDSAELKDYVGLVDSLSTEIFSDCLPVVNVEMTGPCEPPPSVVSVDSHK